MSRSKRVWWLFYGLGSLLALAALGWISSALLDLEREKEIAQHETQQANNMRLALWRMDSWLSPRLAQEAARPYFEYLSFVPSNRAYTRFLNRIEVGEVLSPSPLLDYNSDFFPLHFQLDDNNSWSSPQVPQGNQLDLASAGHVSPDVLASKRELLDQVRSSISPEGLLLNMSCVEIGFQAQLPVDEEAAAASSAQQELSKRVEQNILSQNESNFNLKGSKISALSKAQVAPVFNGMIPLAPGAIEQQEISVGPLLPNWVGDASQKKPFEIYFLRRVQMGQALLLQGFVANWDSLKSGLLGQVNDLFPAGSVDLVRANIADSVHAAEMLASVPARLVVDLAPPAPTVGWTPARVTLGIGWFAVLMGLAGFAFALRASISYGEKRSRFASSVTHELRTPLTTFRMYTEMLVKGMVGEDKRMEYLQTLQRESDRLSILVENVLAYARLEDGRARLARDLVVVSDLVDRARASLEERVKDGDHQLEIQMEVPEGTSVLTDAVAVEQVLFNLVDNACKYGHKAGAAEILLRVELTAGKLCLQVQDAGPGVPTQVAKAIFKPFDRGAVQAADPNPGIGLGLALCRGLARDLGGKLELQHSPSGGACFGFWIPAS